MISVEDLVRTTIHYREATGGSRYSESQLNTLVRQAKELALFSDTRNVHQFMDTLSDLIESFEEKNLNVSDNKQNPQIRA